MKTETNLKSALGLARHFPRGRFSFAGPRVVYAGYEAQGFRTKGTLIVDLYLYAHASNPYVLYAASNLGSFAALIAYPIVIEPVLPLTLIRPLFVMPPRKVETNGITMPPAWECALTLNTPLFTIPPENVVMSAASIPVAGSTSGAGPTRLVSGARCSTAPRRKPRRRGMAALRTFASSQQM